MRRGLCERADPPSDDVVLATRPQRPRRPRRAGRPLTISPTSEIVLKTDQVSTDLQDEVVILNLTNSTYYGLSGAGVRVWALLQEAKPRTVQDLCEVLLAEFDVSPERCEQEVQALAQALAEAGLVEIRDSSAD